MTTIYDFIDNSVDSNKIIKYGDNYYSYNNKLYNLNKVILEYQGNNLIIYIDNFYYNTPKKLISYIKNTIKPDNYYFVNYKLLSDITKKNDISVLDYDYRIQYINSTFSKDKLHYLSCFYNIVNIKNKLFTLFPIKPLLFSYSNKYYVSIYENKINSILDITQEYNNHINKYGIVNHYLIDNLFLYNESDHAYIRVGNLLLEKVTINNYKNITNMKYWKSYLDSSNDRYSTNSTTVLYKYFYDNYQLYSKYIIHDNISYRCDYNYYWKIGVYWE